MVLHDTQAPPKVDSYSTTVPLWNGHKGKLVRRTLRSEFTLPGKRDGHRYRSTLIHVLWQMVWLDGQEPG